MIHGLSLLSSPFFNTFLLGLDSTTTVDFFEVKRSIERELNQPLRSVFAYVDPTPLASASIAQVHVGRLLDGQEVVIKVGDRASI